jgi:hypothetical protein
MRRFLLLPVVVSALTVLAGSKSADAPSPAAERARLLHRDRGLIEKCVGGGISLAKAGDALQRAELCHDVAHGLADEIEVAVRDHDAVRAELLGEHFRRLLTGGVAPNLSATRQRVPPGSTDERKLLEVGERNARMADDLERKLRPPGGAADADVEVILRAVADGRSEVKKALQGPVRN